MPKLRFAKTIASPTLLTFALSICAHLPAAGAAARPATTRPATQPTRDTADAAPAAGEIVALDDKMTLWWIDPASRYRMQDGELVVHNPAAKDGAFSGFIGGPSWENHHVSLEFMVERDTSPALHHPNFNVQIAPHNMAMFFQIYGRACNICVYTPEVNNGRFTHVSDKPAPPITIGHWHRLEVISDNGEITMLMDGSLLNQAQIPASTRGMLGLLVNFGSDAIVHIRDMRVTLLEPTAQQLAESLRNAKDNWDAQIEELKKAGKPLPKAPW